MTAAARDNVARVWAELLRARDPGHRFTVAWPDEGRERNARPPGRGRSTGPFPRQQKSDRSVMSTLRPDRMKTASSAAVSRARRSAVPSVCQSWVRVADVNEVMAAVWAVREAPACGGRRRRRQPALAALPRMSPCRRRGRWSPRCRRPARPRRPRAPGGVTSSSRVSSTAVDVAPAAKARKVSSTIGSMTRPSTDAGAGHLPAGCRPRQRYSTSREPSRPFIVSAFIR